MTKSWQAYALHILVHNYLGDIDALTVQGVVSQHLPALVQGVRSMLANNTE